jgi:phosphoribosylformylglycinamidine synthase
MVIDGEAMPLSLMKIVKHTLESNHNNSIIAFCDNSSGMIASNCHYNLFLTIKIGIKGYETEVLVPQDSRKASQYVSGHREQHIIFTAETHNFPSGITLLLPMNFHFQFTIPPRHRSPNSL